MPTKAAVIVLLAAGCSSSPDPTAPATGGEGSRTYTVLLDAPTTDAEGLTYAGFFPGRFSVHPGDTVGFVNEGTMNPHSVTLGAEADRSNLPPLLQPDGTETPLLGEPCFLAGPPAPDMMTCPETAPASSLEWPAFDGTGFWSSGVEEGAPALALDPAIAPGAYAIVCTIHLDMSATVQVVPADEPIPTPEEVLAEGRTAQEAAVEAGDSAAPAPEPTGEVIGTAIVAGWDTPALNVNRFEPEDVTIAAGDSVTWSVEATYGHNVVFADLIGGEVIDSGLLWGDVEHGIQTFTLAFEDPGTYDYVCTFHTSMAGTVGVT